MRRQYKRGWVVVGPNEWYLLDGGRAQDRVYPYLAFRIHIQPTGFRVKHLIVLLAYKLADNMAIFHYLVFVYDGMPNQ